MLFERTASRPQETPDFELNKQMETLSFSPPINLVEEGKWLLAVIYFDANNSVFNITDKNKSFSLGTPGYWRIPSFLPDRIFDKLKELLELRSQNYTELPVREAKKGGTRKKMENIGYNSAGFDLFKVNYPLTYEQKKILILRICGKEWN